MTKKTLINVIGDGPLVQSECRNQRVRKLKQSKRDRPKIKTEISITNTRKVDTNKKND